MSAASRSAARVRTRRTSWSKPTIATYLAKEAGKGRIAVVSAATRRTTARVTWAERVAQAVHEGLFELYCQPIVDFASDAVARWELLLRLPGDNGELILPSQFLYTAERSGLILEIDRWVLGEAVVLIAAQTAAGRELLLEVNISGRSVGDPQLLSLIEEALDRTAIDPASLDLRGHRDRRNREHGPRPGIRDHARSRLDAASRSMTSVPGSARSTT